MSAVAQVEITEEVFLAKAAALSALSGALTQLGAAVLLAADLGIAKDSRSFARTFGLEHALVLRAVTEMSGENASLLRVTHRNERTQRTAYSLTAAAETLLASAQVRSSN